MAAPIDIESRRQVPARPPYLPEVLSDLSELPPERGPDYELPSVTLVQQKRLLFTKEVEINRVQYWERIGTVEFDCGQEGSKEFQSQVGTVRREAKTVASKIGVNVAVLSAEISEQTGTSVEFTEQHQLTLTCSHKPEDNCHRMLITLWQRVERLDYVEQDAYPHKENPSTHSVRTRKNDFKWRRAEQFQTSCCPDIKLPDGDRYPLVTVWSPGHLTTTYAEYVTSNRVRFPESDREFRFGSLIPRTAIQGSGHDSDNLRGLGLLLRPGNIRGFPFSIGWSEIAQDENLLNRTLETLQEADEGLLAQILGSPEAGAALHDIRSAYPLSTEEQPRVLSTWADAGNVSSDELQVMLMPLVRYAAEATDYQLEVPPVPSVRIAVVADRAPDEWERLLELLQTRGINATLVTEERAQTSLAFDQADVLILAFPGSTQDGALHIEKAVQENEDSIVLTSLLRPEKSQGRTAAIDTDNLVQAALRLGDGSIIVSKDEANALPAREQLTAELELPIAEALQFTALASVHQLVSEPSLTAHRAADVMDVLRGSGLARVGVGYGTGHQRARDALLQALTSSTLEADYKDADALMVSFIGPQDLETEEAYDAADYLRQRLTTSEMPTLVSSTISQDRDSVEATLIATGFDRRGRKRFSGISIPADSDRVLVP